ncbi:hypothetical protein HYPBUDRAFT_155335 [Hyphopichia burtonii NRRL Y-1933]|uniref:rRNA methyltransferase 2, mitochondrial n=1 Tax=Hyphopichia burtonii NRRL Y-1933 TaxID=984485 RepID=A0A1E4RT49_9ASCO|nr:hypothetical protein HYPBUDRAFT_155335 [Hyphopichia burtonii NRRL Y-1933]ODV70440.1 hypothetical protein HYPBUDRAFT_155335 [Hyphopichia burtonii NRRL Y-1933]
MRSFLPRHFGPESQNSPDNPIKLTRQEKINRTNLSSHAKLYYTDREFGIFHKGVRTVLDLGYMPGNWSSYAKDKLLQVHETTEEEFSKECHIAGFDILFGTPPLKVSTIQGNIYSQSTHSNIHHHFKEVALRRLQDASKPRLQLQDDHETSYIDKEIDQAYMDQLDEAPSTLAKTRLANRAPHELKILASLKPQDYQPDLILSDLCAPFYQNGGFFNNTSTRPYIRTGNNPGLNNVLQDPLKSLLDLADASLLLACSLLKKGGDLVLRIAKVDLNDPELRFLELKLKKVFNVVVKWHYDDYRPNTIGNQELFFICRNKKHQFTIIYNFNE